MGGGGGGEEKREKHLTLLIISIFCRKKCTSGRVLCTLHLHACQVKVYRRRLRSLLVELVLRILSAN